MTTTATTTTTPALDGVYLDIGQHDRREVGMCAMEAAAWIAGERHTDRPDCVDASLTRYVQRMNDTVGDDERQRLLAYVPRLIGTARDGHADHRELVAIQAHRRLASLLATAAGLDPTRGQNDFLDDLYGAVETPVAEVTAGTYAAYLLDPIANGNQPIQDARDQADEFIAAVPEIADGVESIYRSYVDAWFAGLDAMLAVSDGARA